MSVLFALSTLSALITMVSSSNEKQILVKFMPSGASNPVPIFNPGFQVNIWGYWSGMADAGAILITTQCLEASQLPTATFSITIPENAGRIAIEPHISYTGKNELTGADNSELLTDEWLRDNINYYLTLKWDADNNGDAGCIGDLSLWYKDVDLYSTDVQIVYLKPSTSACRGLAQDVATCTKQCEIGVIYEAKEECVNDRWWRGTEYECVPDSEDISQTKWTSKTDKGKCENGSKCQQVVSGIAECVALDEADVMFVDLVLNGLVSAVTSLCVIALCLTAYYGIRSSRKKNVKSVKWEAIQQEDDEEAEERLNP